MAKKDPWSVADTAGSVANYLRQKGWRRGRAVMTSAVVSPLAAKVTLQTGLDAPYTLTSLEETGIRPSLANVSGDLSDEAYLISLDNEDGSKQLLIGFHNFYVITRFNLSVNYATVVHLPRRRAGIRLGTRSVLQPHMTEHRYQSRYDIKLLGSLLADGSNFLVSIAHLCPNFFSGMTSGGRGSGTKRRR